MDRAVAPTYDSAMTSGSTASQTPSSSTSQRSGPRRTALVVAAVILGMVVAGFIRLVHGGDAEPVREVSSQRASSPTEQHQHRAARPALPQAQPAEPVQATPVEPAPGRPRFVGVGAAEANR